MNFRIWAIAEPCLREKYPTSLLWRLSFGGFASQSTGRFRRADRRHLATWRPKTVWIHGASTRNSRVL